MCFILFWGRAKACSIFFISYALQFVPENINNDLSLVTPDAIVIMVFEALFRRKQLWQVGRTELGLMGFSEVQPTILVGVGVGGKWPEMSQEQAAGEPPRFLHSSGYRKPASSGSTQS